MVVVVVVVVGVVRVRGLADVVQEPRKRLLALLDLAHSRGVAERRQKKKSNEKIKRKNQTRK